MDAEPPKTDERDIVRSADFSPCRTWRYTLKRSWGDGPVCVFVLLNPSTADENHDDPTNRRGIAFARSWGYEGVTFVNLFAFRTPKPAEMKRAADPIGPENNAWLLCECENAPLVVAAWGNHGTFRKRAWSVRQWLIGEWKCFGLTRQGQPKHPLYLPSRSQLVSYPHPPRD